MIIKYPDYCRISTDGSKSNSEVDCLVMLKDGITPFSVLKLLVLSAEHYAIKLVIFSVLEENFNNNFLVCMDSLTALKSLQKVEEQN